MGTGGKIKLEEGTAGGTYVGFKAPDTEITSDLLWELPATDGIAGQVMATNGTKQLYWGNFAEATATANTDSSLQAAINSEITSRTVADSSLQASILAEATNRTVADSSLQASILAEATNRTVADSSLQASILAEATNRTVADSSLQAAINTKVTSNTIITPATATKITYDGNGLVTGSSSLIASDIPSLDAAKLTSGQIDIARIPPAAIERLVIVATQAARFALTTATAQNGDTIKQSDTGEMFYVIDDVNLGNSAGYAVYTAGTASACPWSGVTSKPAYATQAASATLDGYLTAAAQNVGGVKNFVNGILGPGSVPIGGMVTVMSSTHANFWQPPLTGAIKDGFMRANGHTITAQNVTDGCVIPAGTVLPNMIAKYPKGNTTSGASSGSNSTTITSAHLPQHTHGFGTIATQDESAHTHSWGGWWSNDNSTTVASPEGDGNGNTYSDQGNGVFAGSYWGAGTYKAVASGGMNSNTTHGHTIDGGTITATIGGSWTGYYVVQTPAGVKVVSATEAGTTGTSAPNIDHTHNYYLPSHRHFLKARASGTATHKHGITGSTDNGGFANNSFPNEPAYVEVIWVIRVK